MGLAIIIPDVSFADANLGQVTLQGNIPIESLSVVGETDVVATEYQYTVSYYPVNTSQRNVTWSIVSGNEYANISTGGLLTISQDANYSEVVIKAQSVDNPEIFAMKNITVTYQSSSELVILEGFGLKSDGNAFVDVFQDFTGEKRINIVASNWELIFKPISNNTSVNCLFGSTDGGGATGAYLNINTVFKVASINFSTAILGSKIKAINSVGTCKLYENDLEVESKTGLSEATSAASKLCLHGRFNSPINATDLICNTAAIYGFKLSTLASGEVCDLIPCRYRGTLGWYNRKNDSILLPENGTFILES